MLLTSNIDSDVKRRQALARVYALLIRLAEASENTNALPDNFVEKVENKEAQATTDLIVDATEPGAGK